MLGYYLDLALRSLRRNRILTVLMIAAIGLGVGACMTMVTVLHVLSRDPLPGRSATLFYPQLDPRDAENYQRGGEPADQLTWSDATNLLRARRAERQAAMAGGQIAVHPQAGHAFYADARFTTADFFAMFDTPFAQGGGWTQGEDEGGARVAVLSSALAGKLFGSAPALGRTLRLEDKAFRVVGVLGPWRPAPHFYDLSYGGYKESEDVFLPLSAWQELHPTPEGNLSCWGGTSIDFANVARANCTWLQFWVQLSTPAARRDYQQFLLHYAQEQQRAGRYVREPNVRLRSLMEWLAYNRVVPGNVQLETQLAFAFLLICLVNTVAMLLVKFLRRGGELGVRRALGASRREIFAQLLIESSLVGLAGGVVGLVLSVFGLWVVRQQPAEYAGLAHLDGSMLPLTLLLAVGAALLAALFPAWTACRLSPARMLKIQ